MACVYIHRRLTDGQPFYIGVGKSVNRANHKSTRTRFWKRIVSKYGYTIEILKNNLTYEQAEELEKVLISWYGRLDNNTGVLCNMTDGGNSGANGRKMSEKNLLILRKPIHQYDLEGNYIASYPSITEASKMTGANRGNISICANPSNNRKKTSGGFRWSYNKTYYYEGSI